MLVRALKGYEKARGLRHPNTTTISRNLESFLKDRKPVKRRSMRGWFSKRRYRISEHTVLLNAGCLCVSLVLLFHSICKETAFHHVGCRDFLAASKIQSRFERSKRL